MTIKTIEAPELLKPPGAMASVPEPGQEESFEMTDGRRRVAMLGLCLAAFIASLDTSMTNMALPTISESLGATLSEVIAMVTIYQLIMVAAMLPFSALGEVWGHRKVILTGLCIFISASIWCGIAPTLENLLWARALQGLGASAIISSNIALIRLIYPKIHLGQGLGLNALVVSLSLAGGPVFASAMLYVTSWHWIFYLNVPVGILALLLIFKAVPENVKNRIGQFDGVASFLCAGVFGLLVYGMGAISREGVNHSVIFEWMGAICLLIFLIWWEAGSEHKVLPVDLMKNPVFAISSATTIFTYTTQGLAMVALPFLLLNNFDRGIVEVGLLISLWPIMTAMMSPVAGSLSDRISAGVLAGMGLVCLAIGMLGLAVIPHSSSNLMIIPFMVISGLGFGLFMSPNQRATIAAAPADRVGSAGGILGISRIIGQAAGAAIVAWCMAMNPATGIIMALWIGVTFALIASVASFLRSDPVKDKRTV